MKADMGPQAGRFPRNINDSDAARVGLSTTRVVGRYVQTGQHTGLGFFVGLKGRREPRKGASTDGTHNEP
jgi:hypothetical protein